MYLHSYPSCVSICLPCRFYLSYVGDPRGCGIFRLESMTLTLLIVVLLGHLFCWVTFQTITPSLKEDLPPNAIAGKHWINPGKINGYIVSMPGIAVGCILVIHSNEIEWHPKMYRARSVGPMSILCRIHIPDGRMLQKGLTEKRFRCSTTMILLMLQMREPQNHLTQGNTCFRLCSSASMLSPYC